MGLGPRQLWRSPRTVTTKADGDVERWPFRAGRLRRVRPPGSPAQHPQLTLLPFRAPPGSSGRGGVPGFVLAPPGLQGLLHLGLGRPRSPGRTGAEHVAALSGGRSLLGQWLGRTGWRLTAVGQWGQGGVLGVVMAEWPGCQGRPAPSCPGFLAPQRSGANHRWLPELPLMMDFPENGMWKHCRACPFPFRLRPWLG